MDSVPDELTCPLSLELFKDAVIGSDGHTYSRAAIERHLRENPWSPMTRQPMSATNLIPNRTVQTQVDKFQKSSRITKVVPAPMPSAPLETLPRPPPTYTSRTVPPPSRTTREPSAPPKSNKGDKNIQPYQQPYQSPSVPQDLYFRLMMRASQMGDGAPELLQKYPLHFAAMSDESGAVRAFLQAGGDVFQRDSKGRAPIHVAAEAGFIEAIHELQRATSQRGLIVDQRTTSLRRLTDDGKCPLCFAQTAEVAQTLIDTGENPKGTDSSNPISYAVTTDLGVVRVLLNAGANPFQEEILKLLAVRCRELFVEIIEGTTDRDHLTVALQAVCVLAGKNRALPTSDWAKSLIARGADTQHVLCMAVAYDDHAMVAFLLAEGADPNVEYNNTVTPITSSGVYVRQYIGITLLQSDYLSVECVKALLAGGADPNIHTENCDPPLFKATVQVRLEVVEALVAAGADPNAKNAAGKTPLMAAMEKRQFTRPSLVSKILNALKLDLHVCDNEGNNGLMYILEWVARCDTNEPIVPRLLMSSLHDKSLLDAANNRGDSARTMIKEYNDTRIFCTSYGSRAYEHIADELKIIEQAKQPPPKKSPPKKSCALM